MTHVFATFDNQRWLIDTGASRSFGKASFLTILGRPFLVRETAHNHLGLTTDALSALVGCPCDGLLGTDILNRFDHIFDAPGGKLTVSSGDLPLQGHAIPLDFWGIPTLKVEVGGKNYSMLLDTGAQLSYFMGEDLTSFPYDGVAWDFYPSFGWFETPTHRVPVALGGRGGVVVSLRCGSLPREIEFLAHGTAGFLGNEIMQGRKVGYFPRRRTLVVEDVEGVEDA